jgi:hypothetical protein
MSTQDELNWDDVLGGVEAVEDQRKKEGKTDDFETIPKGPYPVVVQEAEKQTSTTGKDMIKAKVQITEGPYVNRTLFNYFVFGKKEDTTLNRITLNNLAAFGINREFIATNRPSIAAMAEALVGLKAMATIGIQDKGEYKGRNEVKGFKPIDGAVQPAPQVAAPKPAGVPNIPTPAPEAAPAAPSIPVPDVPVGTGSAEEPF